MENDIITYNNLKYFKKKLVKEAINTSEHAVDITDENSHSHTQNSRERANEASQNLQTDACKI